jgi:phosphoglycerol transferase
MIFQFPYIPFPEHPPVNGMIDYDHFKAYLHSKSLHWSYGAIKGREGDAWQKSIVVRPVPELVESLSFAGFNGIYVDRYGYGDNGAAIESALSKSIGTNRISSNSGRLAFFNLLEYSKNLRERYTEEEWLEKQELALHSLILDWRDGFSDLESSPEKTWRWCSSRGELDLYNTAARERKVVLEMSLSSAYEEFSNLTISGPLYSDQLKINMYPKFYTLTLTVPPGHHALEFVSDARRVNAPNDPRYLVFRVDDFSLRELK